MSADLCFFPAVDLAPRPATHDELKAWRMEAHRHLNLAIPAVTAIDPQAGAELKREASAIAARVSRFEAVILVSAWRKSRRTLIGPGVA